MAKPTYYPDWATQTVTLPGTGNTNKIRPKETIRNVGMDFGQIMTCEEMNWVLNNFGLWIHYIVDEFFPTLPNTYLPLVGTKITMAGDATGNVTWNGNKEVTLSIQVVDNSHNHLSANITDATSSVVTPNVLVKRDGGGAIYGGDVYCCGTSATDPATYFFRNFAGQTVGEMSSYYNNGGSLVINRFNPGTGGRPAGITLDDGGFTLITNPRQELPQEGAANSLVRFDYMWAQVNTVQSNLNSVNNNLTNTMNAHVNNLSNRITDVQNYLQGQITNNLNYVNGNFVLDIRLGGAVYIDVRTNAGIQFPAGNVQSGLHSNYNDGNWELDHVYYRPIQKYVNGNWYTVGSL